MYRIVRKEALRPTVTLYEIEAPLIAKKAQPGQFIILRTDENGERIPITINAYDPEKGTVTIIVQTVGATTVKLSHMKEGDCLADFVGPLGKPTETEGKKKVCVVGGGTGNALAYPLACGMHKYGVETVMIAGFKTKDLVILEDEFRAGVDELYMMTDDGSYGEKGFTTAKLEELIQAGYIHRKGKGGKKEKVTSKPFHYISSDGFDMYVGKNNFQNDELTFKFANGNDWWFHAKKMPGSHVIVRTGGKELPDRTFEEAASLAAYYSKGRDQDKVEIDYVIKKEVKKPASAKPGFVVYYTNYSMMASTDISAIKQAD